MPLSSVAKFKYTVGPVTVNHSGQIPSVTISFNLAPGVSLGTAVTAVQQAGAQDVLPPTIAASFSGIAAGVHEHAAGPARAAACSRCS